LTVEQPTTILLEENERSHKLRILGTISKLIAFGAIVVLLVLLGYAVFGSRVSLQPSPLVGSEAPDFTLNLFNGDVLRLSDLKGKAVLLNFWASWCGPCKEEAPALEASWERYKDKGVVFLGINVWDDRESALSYLDRFGGGYPNGIDQKGEIAVNYGVAGVPETYFIDPSGRIVNKYTGLLTEESIDYFLGKALSSPQKDELTKKTNAD
jgi:cytochrome c biogenesis protein CcmG/thiol:disulfide interchange protein DsbE